MMSRPFSITEMTEDYQKKYGVNRVSKRTRQKPQMKESDLQAMCEQYLNIVNLLYFRLPDKLMEWMFGYSRAQIPQRVRGECKRYLHGWPDLMIFKDGKYLAVELKTEGGRVKHEQRRKLKILGGNVIRTFEDFQKLVDDWRKE